MSTRQSSNMVGSSGGGSVCETAIEVVQSRKQPTHTQAEPCSGIQIVEKTAPSQFVLLDLPVEILEKICGYLNYNTIASLRPVCLIIFSVEVHICNLF